MRAAFVNEYIFVAGHAHLVHTAILTLVFSYSVQ